MCRCRGIQHHIQNKGYKNALQDYVCVCNAISNIDSAEVPSIIISEVETLRLQIYDYFVKELNNCMSNRKDGSLETFQPYNFGEAEAELLSYLLLVEGKEKVLSIFLIGKREQIVLYLKNGCKHDIPHILLDPFTQVNLSESNLNVSNGNNSVGTPRSRPRNNSTFSQRSKRDDSISSICVHDFSNYFLEYFMQRNSDSKESKESLNNVHHKNQPRLHFIFDHVIALHIIIEEIQTFIEYELPFLFKS